MFHDILFLSIGLVLIIAGGDYLTDGAEAIARRFKISNIVIGLTVVAFGSSTPDFVVALMSTLEGKASLGIGDIVGANIFDLLLVVGIMAIVTPIPASRGMRVKELPMLVLSSIALFICGDDTLIDRWNTDLISRTDGLLLIAFFIIYMRYTLSMAHEQNLTPASAAPTMSAGATAIPVITSTPPPANGAKIQQPSIKEEIQRLRAFTLIRRLAPPKDMSPLIAAICIIGGLAALVVGGNWIVDGASGIALKAGLSQSLVGLTIVAVGSSVPDLATSLIAALKKQTGIALGNVVGACVFNVFFIIGVCSSIRPMHPDNITFIDYGTLVTASVLLLIFGCMTRRRAIVRWQGILLTLAYCAYMAYLVIFKS